MKKRTKYIIAGILIIIVLGVIAKKAGWLGEEKGIEVAVGKSSAPHHR